MTIIDVKALNAAYRMAVATLRPLVELALTHDLAGIRYTTLEVNADFVVDVKTKKRPTEVTANHRRILMIRPGTRVKVKDQYYGGTGEYQRYLLDEATINLWHYRNERLQDIWEVVKQ